MAELDYAFLAEYAKVEPGGNLTAVGASYTHLFVPAFPNQHLVSVAGRVRAAVGESPSLRITFQTPNETFQMQADVQLNAVPDARPYGPALDMVGLQFAMSFVVPLPTQGLYEVHLALDEVHVRMLAFTAAQQADKA